MKLGLLSDPHGDIDALWKAIGVLEGQGVNELVCLGDLVEKGPHGNEVVDLIQEKKIPCIKGNHDHHVTRTRPLNLTLDTLYFMKNLPSTIRMDVAGFRILLAHGTPSDHSEYLFAYSEPETYRRVFDSNKFDILILGHTHEPMLVDMGEGWIVNPGSVCEDYAVGSGTCALLSLPEMAVQFYHVKTGRKTTSFDYIDLSD